MIGLPPVARTPAAGEKIALLPPLDDVADDRGAGGAMRWWIALLDPDVAA